MDNAIETQQLTKVFEKPRGWRRIARPVPTTAVEGVSFHVQRGELFGLLGPNGAGKTTLVKMLCTLILPSSGTATVAARPLTDAGAIRARVGLVVSDERSFYWRLSGWQNLKFFAVMYGLRGRAIDRRVAEVLAAVKMERYAQERFSGYSTGMKQRIAIARGLLHQPEILFLDEPSRSLDPTATEDLHRLILELVKDRQVTVFLITHDLAEAEKLCDRVAVMHRGQLRTVGRPAALREQLRHQLHYTLRADPLSPEMTAGLQELVPHLEHRPLPDLAELRFQADESGEQLTAVLDCLRGHGLTIYSVQGQPPSLEEVFQHYTRDLESNQSGSRS